MAIELTLPIKVTKEVTVAETSEYDSLWITHVHISGSPGSVTQVEATFLPWKKGTVELAPEDTAITLKIEDLFTSASSDPLLAAAAQTLTEELARQLALRGKI